MPSEQEELRLTVSLVDNASAGIASLRNQIQGLTSGRTKQSFDTFKRQQGEMGEQIKELAKAASGGEKALLGYIGRFGALGLVASAGTAAMKEWARSINDISRLGQALGVPATHIKNIVDQLKEHGASQQEATNEVRGFTQALVDMGRVGSPQYQALLNRAGAYSQQMAATIKAMERVDDIEGKLNIARQAAANVEAARFRQDQDMGKSVSQSRTDALQAEREFLGHLGLHLETQQRISGEIKSMTAEQQKATQQAIAAADSVTEAWNKLGAAADLTGEKMLKALAPLTSSSLDLVTPALNAIARSFDDIADAQAKLKQGDWAGALFGRDQQGNLAGAAKLFQEPPHVPSTAMPRGGWHPHAAAPAKPFQHGGIVNRPTLAMLGEAGPEAVVPLGGEGVGRVTEDNTRETSDNTKQLRMLNDQLFTMLHPLGGAGGGGGGVMRGLGGLPGMGSLPGLGGGGAPYGSSVGAGTGAGAGESHPRYGRGGGLLGDGGPGGSTAPPSGNLAAQRAGFMKEINANPRLRDFVIDAAKHEGGIQSNLEQIFNYAAMRHMTIDQALHSGQYGPVTGRNRDPRMGNISAKLRAQGEAALAKVGAGSNLTDYATDQGMAGDPNFAKYMSDRQRWNMHKVEGAWFSAHGEAGRRWAEKQKAADADAARAAIDAQATQTHKIEATGKLTANINAPSGTDVSVEGGGVFKRLEVNRQVQMEKAARGPSGVGHN